MWPKDPKNDQPSVSLALLMISTLVVLTALGLDIAGKIKSEQTGAALEFFFGCASLYFGRRISWTKSGVDVSGNTPSPAPIIVAAEKPVVATAPTLNAAGKPVDEKGE
jgi:hypothetical protein